MKSTNIVRGIVLALVALALGGALVAETSIAANAAVFPSIFGH